MSLFRRSLALSTLGAASAWCVTSVTFDEATHLALEQNPSLAAIRAQGESFKEKARLALSPNEPVLSLNKNNAPALPLSARGASNSVGLTLTLGFPGKAFLQRDILENQADSLREQSTGQEMQIIMDLSYNYVSLYVNREKIRLQAEDQKQSESLVRLIEKKYLAAQASQVDLMNAKATLSTLEHDRVVVEGEHENLLTQFRNLIKRPGDSSYEPQIPQSVVIPEIKKTPEELIEVMFKNSPALKSAHYQKESSKSALAAAKMAALPDFQLGGTITTYNEPNAAANPGVLRDYSMSIGIAIPLFFPFNEMAGISSARKDLQAATFQDDAARMQAIADLRSAMTDFKALKLQLTNLEKQVVPMNRSSYDMTLKYYSFGKSDYLRLKDARQSWNDSQRQLNQAILDATKSYNQIMQLVGCDFAGESKFHACM